MTTTHNFHPIIYDAHSCPSFNITKKPTTLNRYKKAGITYTSLNVGFGKMLSTEILPIIHHLRSYILQNDNEFKLITEANEITNCKNTNKLGIGFDLEGIDALDGNIDMLDKYHKYNVKQLLLVYNKNNAAGGGCLDIDTGLTPYGKSIVKRMNQIGMIIDCSHTGIKTTLEIMEQSTHPVVFSHSNPAALVQHPRNITDEQIKACAQIKGVIGINGISIFLGCKKPQVSHLIEHIDYITQLVGPHHVGIGLDYVYDHEEVKSIVKSDKNLFPPEQKFNDVELFEPELVPQLSIGLFAKGYNREDVSAILGGNFLRVANEVWK